MSKLTVNDLKKETRVTDKQLGQACRKKHLKEIAQHVGNYPQFASKFDLPPPVASGIDTDLKLSYDQKAEKVFLYWWENARNRTYLKFVQACLELGEGGIARKMCKLSKESVEDQPYSETISDTEVKEDSPGSPKIEGMQMFCTTDDEKLEHVDPADASNIPTDAQGGVARYHLLWDVKQASKLKVHFLNPDILEKEHWKCGHAGPLTVNNVLDWANVWNSHADNYPQIADELATREKADIRVEFRRKGISWSKVGTAATWETDKNKPTMVLNLYGMTKADQRSMVIHEFGHALGLDHEHQHSDFWDVLESKDDEGQYRFIIGKRLMKDGNDELCQRACDAVFKAKLKEPSGRKESCYDSDSIMHYWFDKNWLLSKYREPSNVAKYVKDERERMVLMGVHKRDYHNGNLAENPSKLDYETLNGAYGTLYTEAMHDVPTVATASSPQSDQSGAQPEYLIVSRLGKRALASDKEDETSPKRFKKDIGSSSDHPIKSPKLKNTTESSSTVLTQDDIPTICERLASASNDWFNLGLALEVKYKDLQSIQEQFPKNERRLTSMMAMRLQVADSKDPVTWPYICECLRHPLVMRFDVADNIEQVLGI